MQALLTMSSVAWLETLACDGNQNAEKLGFVVRTNSIRKGYNLTMEVGKNSNDKFVIKQISVSLSSCNFILINQKVYFLFRVIILLNLTNDIP